MGKIEWTEKTWNPVAGCSDVSEGCRNCYARGMAKRLEAMGSAKYAGLTVMQGSHNIWTGKIAFDEKALLAPMKRSTPTMYFVNSMSDLFHENVTDEMLDRIHGIMWACEYMGKNDGCRPGHTFQILTKRAARLPIYYGTDRRKQWAKYAVRYGGGNNPDLLWEQVAFADHLHPRIQIGVSIENQKTADKRIPLLLQTPAAIRFLSVEPMLGPVSFRWKNSTPLEHTHLRHKFPQPDPAGRVVTDELDGLRELDWVIVGGESGHGARPMHPDWARSVRDQCVAAGVAFFFKQWGEWVPFIEGHGHMVKNTHLPATAPVGLLKKDGHFIRPYCQLDAPGQQMCRVGKKTSGRLLDGREWNEMPA